MESNNQCFLKSKEFNMNIRSTWKSLQTDSEFHDMTIACDGKHLPGHKIIFSSCSPIFQKLLKSDLGQHTFIYLQGVKRNDLENLHNYIYHGEVNVLGDDLNNFLRLAQDLKIQGISEGKGINLKLNDPQLLLSSHSSATKMENIYKCDQCNYNATSWPYLNKHMASSHNCIYYQSEVNDYESDKPFLNFESENQNAICEIDNQNEIKIISPITNLANLENEALKDKDKQLANEDTINNLITKTHLSFQSDYCNNKFAQQANLKRHNESVHAFDSDREIKDDKYFCTQCDFKAMNRNCIEIHVKSTHSQRILYSCNICDKTFQAKSGWKSHKKIIHEGIRYPCGQCDFKATTKFYIKDHIKSCHNKEYLFSCDKCSKSFFTKAYLRNHESTHEDTKLQCNQCDYIGTTKIGLKGHLSVHDKNNWFSCSKCDKKLPYKQSMRRHIKVVHKGIRSTCKHCDFKAVDTRTLTNHIEREHMGEQLRPMK